METFLVRLGPGSRTGWEAGFGPSARHGRRGGELGLECDRVVEKTVEDLAAIHQPTGSWVPPVITDEGPIGIVIGEVDYRSVIAGTDLA